MVNTNNLIIWSTFSKLRFHLYGDVHAVSENSCCIANVVICCSATADEKYLLEIPPGSDTNRHQL